MKIKTSELFFRNKSQACSRKKYAHEYRTFKFCSAGGRPIARARQCRYAALQGICVGSRNRMFLPPAPGRRSIPMDPAPPLLARRPQARQRTTGDKIFALRPPLARPRARARKIQLAD